MKSVPQPPSTPLLSGCDTWKTAKARGTARTEDARDTYRESNITKYTGVCRQRPLKCFIVFSSGSRAGASEVGCEAWKELLLARVRQSRPDADFGMQAKAPENSLLARQRLT